MSSCGPGRAARPPPPAPATLRQAWVLVPPSARPRTPSLEPHAGSRLAGFVLITRKSFCSLSHKTGCGLTVFSAHLSRLCYGRISGERRLGLTSRATCAASTQPRVLLVLTPARPWARLSAASTEATPMATLKLRHTHTSSARGPQWGGVRSASEFPGPLDPTHGPHAQSLCSAMCQASWPALGRRLGTTRHHEEE